MSLSCCVWGPVLSVPPTAPVRLTPARASGPGPRPQHSAPAPSPCSWHLVSVTSTSCSDLPGLPVSQPAPWGAVPGVLPFPALLSLEPSLGRPQPAVSASLRGSHFRDSLCLRAVCLRVRGGAGLGAGRGGEAQTRRNTSLVAPLVTPRGAEATHPSSLGPRPSQTRPAPLWPISLQAQGPSSLPGPQRHCPASPSVRSGPVLSAGRCPCVRSASFQTVGPHRGSRAAPRTAELGAQALSIPSPWALCRSPPAGLSSRVRAGRCPCPRLLSGCVHLA